MAALPSRRNVTDLLECARDRLDDALREFGANPKLALHDINDALLMATLAKVEVWGNADA